MTRIVLTRHGETTWHAENRYAGLSDIPLTLKGHEQAQHLAEWACDANLAALWVSPLTRARATAEPVAIACGLTMRVDDRLRELDFGEGEGLTAAEMEMQFGAEWRLFEKDPVLHHLPGGEDPVLAATRGASCLHDIAELYPSGRVLVVAHNTLVRLVLCQLLQIPLSRYRTVFASVRNDALIELALDRHVTTLLQFNVPVYAGATT